MENRIKVKPTIYKDKKEIISEITLKDESIAIVKDTEHYKALKSENYNFFFKKDDGYFVRWGKGDYSKKCKKTATKQELELFGIWSVIWKEKFDLKNFIRDLGTDGSFENTAPEILDWEISEICDGVSGVGPCEFCYKSNVGNRGKNISFEDFKTVFHKIPKSVTTIAFGIGSINKCPDLWNILKYTREHGIIPTITINGDVIEEDLDMLASVVGACATSIYDKDKSYAAVRGLLDRGVVQSNIHAMISLETMSKVSEIIDDVKNDDRLKGLRALVMLSLKPKGRSIGRFNKLPQEKFAELAQKSIDNGIGFGLDSCSAGKFFDFIKDNPQFEYMKTYIEPCESGGKYSAYLNVDSKYFPCSFTEGTKGWEDGLDVINCDDFMKDIWHNERTIEFGKKVQKCRDCNIGCPIYDV